MGTLSPSVHCPTAVSGITLFAAAALALPSAAAARPRRRGDRAVVRRMSQMGSLDYRGPSMSRVWQPCRPRQPMSVHEQKADNISSMRVLRILTPRPFCQRATARMMVRQRRSKLGRGVPRTAIAPTTSSHNGNTPKPGIASRARPGNSSHCRPSTMNSSSAVPNPPPTRSAAKGSRKHRWRRRWLR